MKRLLIASLLSAIVAVSAAATASASSVTYFAAGDIACQPGTMKDATHCHQANTANLIRGGTLGTANGVLALGDTQYSAGIFADYMATGEFNSTWGVLGSLLHPVPGNHEWTDSTVGPNDNAHCLPGPPMECPTLAGYKHYFGTQLGVQYSAGTSTNCPNDSQGSPCAYYSFDASPYWHIIVLDSECAKLVPPNGNGGCATTGKEYKWLTADLDSADNLAHPCLAVAWHRPRFSSGNNGSNPQVDALWQLLANGTPKQNGNNPRLGPWTADLVLNGHDHDYERFARLDATGVVNTAGIREFVVGTGGDDLGTFPGAFVTGSEQHVSGTFGVLRLLLNSGATGAGSYTAEWFKEDGTSGGTSTTNNCH